MAENADKSQAKTVKTVCNMCLKCCGLDARVEAGKLVKITGMKEHPVNRLCVKPQGAASWLHSKERVIHPLRKVNGNWKEITWDEAFEVIGTKLEDVKEKYGAKALVVHLGNPFIGNQIPRVAIRFCSVYGTPNYTSGASLCFAAKGIGHGLTISRFMFPLYPSYRDTRCIVVWGNNPEQSGLPEAAAISSARKRGAKLTVIDPRRIPLAKNADIYAQIRPGTDCALTLGLLNVVIAEGLYDKDFVANWTVGFDQLREHVKDYSPEAVEKITWVPAETIREIAIMYATNKPATISQGVSLDHCTNGVQTSRAIAILIAITGNLDVGNIYNLPMRQTNLRVKGRVDVSEAIGAPYPIYGRFVGETTSALVLDALITGEPYPIKALIIQGSNPLLTWPNTNKVRQAFEKLDLLVVSGLFMTETAKMAHIFLPEATFLEEDRLQDSTFSGMPLIALGNKAVEPPGDCLESWRIWAELGKKMGYAEYFPWQSTDEVFNSLLEPSGITLEELREHPGGILYSDLNRKRKYEEEGLHTPSKKVEIFSQTMIDYGYEPLPTFVEPAESFVTKPELVDKYPFILVSGARTIGYTHSRFRNVPRLRRLVPQPLIEINVGSARQIGIADADMVVVESPRGSITLKAKLTEDIHPKIVSLQHGWDEANANMLTDDKGLDPVSGYPGLKSVMCRLARAE